MKQYDQVAAAATLNIPISILQLGEDYQVTIEDDFQKWKEGLGGLESAGEKDVKLKVYENLNHLLTAHDDIDRPPSPEDYGKEEHVDESMIVDVCAWIKQRSTP